jgi:hypothetical protein
MYIVFTNSPEMELDLSTPLNNVGWFQNNTIFASLLFMFLKYQDT